METEEIQTALQQIKSPEHFIIDPPLPILDASQFDDATPVSQEFDLGVEIIDISTPLPEVTQDEDFENVEKADENKGIYLKFYWFIGFNYFI